VAVRPLRFASHGLTFSPARDLSLIDNRADGGLKPLLQWHDITLEPLKQLGARRFCWINPNRPDLLPRLNYYQVRADESLAVPNNHLTLQNLHLVGGFPLSDSCWQVGPMAPPFRYCGDSLEVTEENGTVRASPQHVHWLSVHNLRDDRNAHPYQFAEHGAFVYLMDDGSMRYFDVIDMFVRPAPPSEEARKKLQADEAYRQACYTLKHRIDLCDVSQLQRPLAEWHLGLKFWQSVVGAMKAVDAYKICLYDFYASATCAEQRQDERQLAKLWVARMDELLPLDTLLEPKPAIPLMKLGPMALRSCGWQPSHFKVQLAHVEGVCDCVAASGTHVGVTIQQVPQSLRDVCLGLTSDALNGGVCFEMHISPIAAITLPLLNRIRAGIPLAATHFAFLYPLDHPVTAEESAGFREAVHGNDLSLLTVGGFLYLAADGSIVEGGIRTLKFGVDGLCFSAARDLDVFVAFSHGLTQAQGQAPTEGDVMKEIEQRQWWRPVTAKHLLRQKVTKFAWMPPMGAAAAKQNGASIGPTSSLRTFMMPGLRRDGVPLADHTTNAAYSFNVHGGFVYRCDVKGVARTVYFDVLADPSAALYAQLEQLEGFQGIADMIADLKQRMLGHTCESPAPIQSREVAQCIQRHTQRSVEAANSMLGEYIHAIANLQAKDCSVCCEPYGLSRKRRVFRVCKHAVCAECEPRLPKRGQCPLCNMTRGLAAGEEEWLQLLDDQEQLVAHLQRHTVNLADLWWTSGKQASPAASTANIFPAVARPQLV